MVEGVKRRNEQSGKGERGTGEGGKRAWKLREEGKEEREGVQKSE